MSSFRNHRRQYLSNINNIPCALTVNNLLYDDNRLNFEENIQVFLRFQVRLIMFVSQVAMYYEVTILIHALKYLFEMCSFQTAAQGLIPETAYLSY